MQNSKQPSVNQSETKRRKMTSKDWTRIGAAFLAGVTVLSIAFGTVAFMM